MVLAALSATLLAVSAGTAASPQSLTISVSRPSVVFGSSLTLSGKISNHKVGEKVEVLAEPSGASSFSTLTTVDTSAGGRWTDVVKPTIETSYPANIAATRSDAWLAPYCETRSIFSAFGDDVSELGRYTDAIRPPQCAPVSNCRIQG